jgi:tetratricopeptide (TPR) repeat protein
MLTLSMIPVPAIGDASPDVRAQAKQHYEAGETFFRLGELDRAITEWRQSYELSRVPLLLYDIAQAYRQKGDKKQALFFYQQYLSIAPTGESHVSAERRVEELKQALAVEDRARTAPPQGPVAPSQSATQSAAPPVPDKTVSIVGTPEPAGSTSSSRKRWYASRPGWVLVGVGVGALGASAALLGVAVSERDKARAAMTQADFDTHHSSSLTFQQAGWPLLGIGAALVVGGTVVLAIRARNEHQ